FSSFPTVCLYRCKCFPSGVYGNGRVGVGVGVGVGASIGIGAIISVVGLVDERRRSSALG
ncbi:unnamed protein product, partial [Heterotrigona itama]